MAHEPKIIHSQLPQLIKTEKNYIFVHISISNSLIKKV